MQPYIALSVHLIPRTLLRSVVGVVRYGYLGGFKREPSVLLT